MMNSGIAADRDVQDQLRLSGVQIKERAGAWPLALRPQLSPVARPRTQSVRYMVPYIGHSDASLQVDFAPSGTYTIDVRAGSRLQRRSTAAVLARIIGHHGFDRLEAILFRDLLNLNVCLAMGMLGFFLSSVEKPAAAAGATYRVQFSPAFPVQARVRTLFASMDGQPAWEPHDLQFQTVHHGGRFWMSRLNLSTDAFEWRHQDSEVHVRLCAKLVQTQQAMHPLTRERMDGLFPFFVANGSVLENYQAVGMYELSGVQCWFIGTMQDVFDKWQLLKKQPGNPVHLLNRLRLAYFAKPFQHLRDELAAHINRRNAAIFTGTGTQAPTLTGAALCFVPKYLLKRLETQYTHTVADAFAQLEQNDPLAFDRYMSKNKSSRLQAFIDFAIGNPRAPHNHSLAQ